LKTVLSVVGARPQFVKAAPLSRRLRQDFREVLVHTGQHYDHGMSTAFFTELLIPEPDVNLGVGSAPHGEQTARMTEGLIGVIRETDPDLVLTYGDTNSTLAASLAALTTGVRLAHVEAGLRSFNRKMPEEVNRIAADHLSDLCLCPTATAVSNLEREGLADRARLTGDVMLDACLDAVERAGDEAVRRHGLTPGEYCFATVHRAENTDRTTRFLAILDGLGSIPLPIAFPVHPRTRAVLDKLEVELPENVTALPPTSYLETLSLAAHARKVITDSGGLQKEAYFLKVPCVTLREETEWTETVDAGWNVLVGADAKRIREAAFYWDPPEKAPDLSAYGGGQACDRIAAEIAKLLG
jgi:UDP-GlcNAc3NAcA epimerase